MSRLRLKQLAQDGATTNQAVVWNGTVWAPATIATYSDEQARDAIGAALVAGSNITITVNDPADTITISTSPPQYWDDVLTSTGGETIVTLGQTPRVRSERVWKRSSGVEVLLDRATDYTISSNIVTLISPLTSGQQIRTYYVYDAGLTGAAATLTSAAIPDTGSSPYGVGAYGVAPFGI